MQDKQKTHAQKEQEVNAYWGTHDCFKKSVEQRPKGRPYVFYDGPPFATGLPHYGHITASIMKDVVPRFWTMRGYHVERVWGWDCHGLPVENIVEKQLNLSSRKAIEEFGIEAFNNECRACVLTYVDEWKRVISRLGRWVDMENAYKTMDVDYMESIWWVFKSLWDKGLIYEGLKPMHICPRCQTVLSNFEVTEGYQDVTDISVTVKLTITRGAYEGASLLVWTTTPWTLPGNVLAAVSPNMKYVIVEFEQERFIVGEPLVKMVFEDRAYQIIDIVHGTDLMGAIYEPLFPFFTDHQNAFRVVSAQFVTDQEGTGIVHIAPGFGEDDMALGMQEKVEPIMHVRMDGMFVPEVADPLVNEGYAVDRPLKEKGKTMDVDVEILKYLAHHGKLFSKKKVVHSYPHCWRCDTPLLNYSTSSWFVRVTDIKDKLIKSNKEINWVPGNIRDGRFGKWLEGSRDWAISRSRFWGAPLPVWKSEDGEMFCIGSREELEELSGTRVTDLHKHVVDEIEITKGGKTFKRIPEVLDCWFESGSMPYASVHYPFERKQQFEQGFPAEFIAEGADQTRGWFYTLHILANALFGMPAFKNVVVNGIVLAEDGKKMSKRLSNYPDPMKVMEQYGADAVRLYLTSTPLMRAENLRFSEEGVSEVSKKYLTIMHNVLSFYTLYKEHDDGRDPNGKHILDTWILARLHQTGNEVTEAFEAYELSLAVRELQSFVTDLSTWYVRRSRDRFKVVGEDRKEALATLRHVIEVFAKMTAPFTPFLAEMLYQGIYGNFDGNEHRLSVHLEDWPLSEPFEQRVIDEMGEARAIVSRILEAREQAGRPVKQVLASVHVHVPSGGINQALIEVILDEVNIKKLDTHVGEMAVEVDMELTSELMREGMARDLVRKVNQMRKEAGLTIRDRIDLLVFSEEREVKKMFDEHEKTLQEQTLSHTIEFRKDEHVFLHKQVRLAEHDVWIGFSQHS